MRSSAALTLGLVFLTTLGVARAATPGWGKRSQIGQLTKTLAAQKSAATAPGKAPGFFRRQPLIQKLAAFLRPGLSVKDDVKKLEGFLSETEAHFGGPISTLEHAALKDGRRMRAEKALALLQFNRRPEEVTEAFIRTSAKVKGAEDIADRDLFVQRWRPIGKPSGKVFVMAPGFLQTGRNFYEQVQLLNKEGHDVVILDQQWGGYTADATRGVVKGGIDRGFGIARDVAELAAYGNEIVEREYGKSPGKQLVLVGTSMGGGPGVLGALKLYDAGRIELGAGRAIPKSRGWILQGAFLGRNKTLINNTLNFLGAIPGVRRLPLPAMGLPLLTDDPYANAKLAAHGASEDLRGRPQAFRATLKDIGEIVHMIDETGAPEGRGYVIHAENDHLASTGLMLDAVKKMGDGVKLDLVRGQDHVMEETLGEQLHILDGAKHVGAK